MTLVEFLLLDALQDVGKFALFYLPHQSRKREQECRQWKIRAKLPFADWWFGREIRKARPSGYKQRVAKLSAKCVRWFAESATFEKALLFFMSQKGVPVRRGRAKKAIWQ